jgi:peptidoglycan/LPS O-acetylase OafA/YrhL
MQKLSRYYRPEIDGLRCIAVISVIFYHAQITIFGIQPFKGGFIGVDIFFVISGYLITSIILKEILEKGSFSFKNFYKRRIRRILPVLIFVMLVSIPFSWIYIYPIDLVSYSKSILYSLGFSSNYYFHYSGLEYGSPESLLKPFLHTWSLSVEEQYYILFPIVLVIVFKYFRHGLIYFLLLCFVISLIAADWGSKNYPSLTFYFLHSRVWELICGSVIAYFEIKKGNRSQNQTLNQILPIFGLFLIFYSIIFFDSKIFHPSFHTLIPVIGVTLILWFTNKDDVIKKILSYKVFVGIGLISYSLYLWHYPIFSFAKNLEIFFDESLGKLILIIITFLFSIFSFYLIERPSRRVYSFKTVLIGLTISTFFIFTYNISVINKEGFSNRVKVKNYQESHTYNYLKKDGKVCFGREYNNLCKFGSKKKKLILLGDSQLASLSFDLYNRTKYNFTFLPITHPGYFHLRDAKMVNKHTKKVIPEYDAKRDDIDKILKNSKNNIIIIGGATSLYLYNKRVEGRAAHWDSMFVDKVSLEYKSASIEKAFIDLIKDLSIDNDVILLYPIPEIGVNLQKKKFENMVRVFNYKYSTFLRQNEEVINFFGNINIPRVHKVYSYKAFCNIKIDLCTTHDDNNFFFFDGYHPSLEGTKMINNLVIKKINQLKNKQ